MVRQSLGEKNFHIFGLLVGDVETAKRFLPGGRKFRYITPAAGGAAQNAVAPAPLGHSATPQHRFSDVCESLGKLGLAPAALDALWSTVAGVLLLGEVMFYDYFAGGEERAAVLADGSLERAAEALAVEPTALASALTRRTLRAGHDDRCTVALSASRAAAARDALAKDVYSTVFEHVVATVNRALSPAAAETEAKAKTKTKTTSGTGIALLDIFGFEAAVEGVNGFEQLCINYANERLQQQVRGRCPPVPPPVLTTAPPAPVRRRRVRPRPARVRARGHLVVARRVHLQRGPGGALRGVPRDRQPPQRGVRAAGRQRRRLRPQAQRPARPQRDRLLRGGPARPAGIYDPALRPPGVRMRRSCSCSALTAPLPLLF